MNEKEIKNIVKGLESYAIDLICSQGRDDALNHVLIIKYLINEIACFYDTDIDVYKHFNNISIVLHDV